MLGIPAYLYRLVPANPILLRVVSVGGKRRRDLLVRSAYLGLLIFLVLFSLLSANLDGGDLDELSKTSTDIFVYLSYLQLGLVALLAPIFTAGAITQEKDSQTYDILLSTPLTNGQIVLGTLLSRLFFVFALLVSGIPVFSVTQIFGGVSFGDILTSTAIAGVTALVCGSLAVAIATFKVGTRRTIFSFYMLIVVYLLGVFLIDKIAYFHPSVLNPNAAEPTYDAAGQTSWMTGIHPFLALRTILEPTVYGPPALTELDPELRGWPFGWYFTNPASFFIICGTLLSLLLVLPSIGLLRRMAQSTTTLKGTIASKLAFLPGVRPPGNRPPRGVWANPIAWREAKTKASATRAGLLRYAFIAAGLIGAMVVCWFYATEREAPSLYIEQTSYNASEGTLFLKGNNQDLYRLADNAKITINNKSVEPDAMNRRLRVVGAPTYETINGSRTITGISLADIGRVLDQQSARRFLLGMVFVEVAVILLIVTNAAASTVTREREDGTLDLLLSTPITSRYYIWGKLRGLVSFSLPLIIVPVVSCGVFVLYDLVRFAGGAQDQWMVFPEALLLIPALLIILVAFASIVGMNLSLRTKTTVRSVMISLALVIGLFAILGFCGTKIVEADQAVSVVFAAFSPLTVIMVLIAPETFGGPSFDFSRSDVGLARGLLFFFSLLATSAYAFAIWGLHKSMVKNFDMTIRRQQR